MFESENELVSILNEYDQTIHDCVLGRTSFQEFVAKYDNFYAAYALDSHESTPEEKKLLEKYQSRIAVHREIWERVIAGGLCSEEDANKDSYIQNGRFGSEVAMKRLKEISAKYFNNFSL